MASYFDWLQNLAFPAWVAGSDSIWSFPMVLFLHSLGMGLSAGAAMVLGLRLLGCGAPLLVSSLRVVPKIFWAGFWLNFVTGSVLFAAYASITGYVPVYYAKLALIAVGVALSVPLRTFVDGEASDAAIPGRIRVLAFVSIATWVGVITTGRLIAYLS
jgi:hypothetical protein